MHLVYTEKEEILSLAASKAGVDFQLARAVSSFLYVAPWPDKVERSEAFTLACLSPILV